MRLEELTETIERLSSQEVIIYPCIVVLQYFMLWKVEGYGIHSLMDVVHIPAHALIFYSA